MAGYVAASILIVLIATVLTRVLMLRRSGTRAMHFGNLDKTDFLIPPVALFYFYTIFAAAFDWPLVSRQRFFHSDVAAWAGIAVCLVGLSVLAGSLVSFGRSFRVGIDVDHPDELVTTGIFSVTRNPIYVGFALILIGEFLVFPNWIPLAYLAGGFALFHRQVLREEEFMRGHYGEQYRQYCQQVRRYV
ncbi:isoprenylcysteine carboxyl methyltransferase [Mycobacterium sp. 1081908.1]|nr:isoprenylcysteine carboxyl methyltransferase [Mycobacterium sp. 1081908.1]